METEQEIHSLRVGGGTVLTILGLGFFLSGLGVAVLFFAGPGGGPSSAEAMPWSLGFLFSAAFALPGIILLFGRRGVAINRSLGWLETWWGLLFPFSRTRYDLSDFQKVALTRHVSRSQKGGSHTTYRVALFGVKEVRLFSSSSYQATRLQGEAIAKACNLPLGDSSSGEEIVRHAAYLDESLRDRARRTGEVPAPPAQPDGSPVRVEITPPDACFEIPGSPLLIYIVIGAVLVFFVSGVLPGLFFMLTREGAGLAILGSALFFVLPVFVVVGILILRVPRSQRIVVSPEYLTVVDTLFIGSRQRRIPANELEELHCPPMEAYKSFPPVLLHVIGPGIVARSDRTELRFGRGLDDQNLSWLRDVVHAIVIAPPKA